MLPSRKSFQPSDQTNLQQHAINKPIANPTPIPSHIGDGNNPPPVPRRQPGPLHQPSLPTSMYGYGVNPYGMTQNFGYGGFMSGYANPMLPGGVATGAAGGVLPTDSMFHGVENVGRSAFETVGSVVQTLSSVSMMLQSTLFAIQNSVQAIASVADQFTHLRSHLVETCISIIRIIKYYFRKLLYLFRVDTRGGVDKIWEEATHQTTNSHDRRGIILFFAVVIGTPYLMWSLLKNIISQSESVNNWQKGIGEHFVAEVKFTYKSNNSDELSVTCGDVIHVAPKHKQPQIKGWILASKDEKHGLVPANYIEILSKSNNVDSSIVVNSKVNEIKEEEEESGKLIDVDQSAT